MTSTTVSIGYEYHCLSLNSEGKQLQISLSMNNAPDGRLSARLPTISNHICMGDAIVLQTKDDCTFNAYCLTIAFNSC